MCIADIGQSTTELTCSHPTHFKREGQEEVADDRLIVGHLRVRTFGNVPTFRLRCDTDHSCWPCRKGGLVCR